MSTSCEQGHTSQLPTTPFARQGEAPGRPLCQRLGGYELLERIGRGGLGDVYRARHLPSGAVVALKVLRGGDEASPAEVRSFEREIEAARRLDHPRILPILDAGVSDGQPFYTMALVSGGSLENRLRSGRIDLVKGVQWLAEVARAVHHAHQQQILHRDLKPANILLDEAEQPLVADFGLAKFLDQTSSPTMTGQLMGSLPYMSPEQAAGRSHHATPATDIWSLGVMLYELLTGQKPFRGEGHTEILRRIQAVEPVPPRTLADTVPADLEAVCLRCLRKHPAERYATAAELAGDLERWLRHEPIASTWNFVPHLPGGSRWGGRSILGLLAALLLGGLLLAPAPVGPGASHRRPTDEERLRAVLARARPGHPVVLLDSRTQVPLARVVLGEDETKLTFRPGKQPWMNTPGVCLFELLPADPKRGDYRLTVEMAQVDGEAVSQVGLYAGRLAQQVGKATVHSFVQATFCEPELEEMFLPGKAPPRQAPLVLAAAVFIDREDTLGNHRMALPGRFLLPDVPRGKEGRFRAYHLDVRAKSWAVGAPGGTAATAPRSAADLGFRVLRRRVPEVANHVPNLSPTGGAGIVIWRSALLVKRVLYEPLPAPVQP
jgi:serine/threonine-protein kinase